MGSPIFFWQQRLGQGGRPFLLHKIRTLKPPFDWRGRKVPEAERVSAIGRLMRNCRFDELAQLLNVLVGDMSLMVHGRLRADQRAAPWPIGGGRHHMHDLESAGLEFLENVKDALDKWYIRNASFRLDLRIIFMTLQCVLQGERLGEAAIAEAFAMRRRQCTADPFEALSPPAIAELSINEPGIDMLPPQLSHIPLREARDLRAR